jgi:hypothetical protein
MENLDDFGDFEEAPGGAKACRLHIRTSRGEFKGFVVTELRNGRMAQACGVSIPYWVSSR